MYFADNIGLDHRAHLCSLIWAFSVPQHILQCPVLFADNKDPDQPALMHRLIRACAVLKLHMGTFRALRIIYQYFLVE